MPVIKNTGNISVLDSVKAKSQKSRRPSQSAAILLVLFLRRPYDQQLRHRSDRYPRARFKAELLQPVAAELDLRHIALTVLVEPCFGLDLQAAHIGRLMVFVLLVRISKIGKPK